MIYLMTGTMFIILPALIKTWAIPYNLDELVYLIFEKTEIPESSTINNLTKSQKIVLQAIVDNTKTGQESIYQHDLKFMGIRCISLIAI